MAINGKLTWIVPLSPFLLNGVAIQCPTIGFPCLSMTGGYEMVQDIIRITTEDALDILGYNGKGME
jgi:hypothetical protein